MDGERSIAARSVAPGVAKKERYAYRTLFERAVGLYNSDKLPENRLQLEFTKARGMEGSIVYPSGPPTYFHGNDLGLNTHAASGIMKNKAATSRVLRKRGMGEHVPDDIVIARTQEPHSHARVFAHRAGYPVFLKPLSGSQGRDVKKARDPEDLDSKVSTLIARYRQVMVQKACSGKREFRVVMLDGEILQAYEKVPLSVTGDGIHNVRELTKKKMARLREKRPAIKFNVDDPDVAAFVAAQNIDEEDALLHIPQEGQVIVLLPTYNLSQGASPKALRRGTELEKALQEFCKELAEKTGLRFCGLDLKASGDKKKGYFMEIIEINGRPGSWHALRSNPRFEKEFIQGLARVLDVLVRDQEARVAAKKEGATTKVDHAPELDVE